MQHSIREMRRDNDSLREFHPEDMEIQWWLYSMMRQSAIRDDMEAVFHETGLKNGTPARNIDIFDRTVKYTLQVLPDYTFLVSRFRRYHDGFSELTNSMSTKDFDTVLRFLRD